MTHASHPTAPQSAPGAPLPDYSARQSGWVGWIVFAAAMLVMLGFFHIIQGLVALFRNEEVFVAGSASLIVSVDYTAWGWTHVIGGTIAILVGACLMTGQMWARIAAVLIALVSAMINVAFLPAYPIWSALMIVVDILVIWAVTLHGSELKER